MRAIAYDFSIHLLQNTDDRNNLNAVTCPFCCLLTVGGLVSPQDSRGLTPLMIAASYGSIRSVKLLIALGSSVSLQDARGYSAFHFAAEKVRVYEFFSPPTLKYFAYCSCPFTFTFTAHPCCCVLQGRLEVINFMFGHVPLLARIHDPKGRRRRPTLGSHLRDIVSWTTNDPGTTPYTLASRNDHWDVLERLNGALLMAKVSFFLPLHALLLESC